MKNYKLVIFDVDGTLLDTTEGVLSSVKYTIQKHNLSPLPEEDLRTFIGPPIQKSFEKFYGLNEEKVQVLAETFRNRYKNFDLLKAVPYGEIYTVLEYLKEHHIKIAVATYKRQDYAVSLLKYYHFDDYTSILYGTDNYNKLRKRDIIQKCIIDSEIRDYSTVLMVGDSENDAVGAAEIGVDFLGVTYGFGFKTKEDVTEYPYVGYAAAPINIIEHFNKGEI